MDAVRSTIEPGFALRKTHAILIDVEKGYLYQRIAEDIRQQILQQQLRPGDKLPTVREMTEHWDCTIGTVQRAYQELARQGLVISRAGQGTHVIKALPPLEETALRRAAIVHNSEAFLLEMLTAGYSLQEIEDSISQAMGRWQVIVQQPLVTECETLRFAGSHDPVLAWLAAHFPERVPKINFQVGFTGSLGGLIALTEGKADLAGCHLWDEQTDTYNEPYVRRLLPGARIALLTLAHRRLGLMTFPKNPLDIKALADLARPGIRFVNRQAGSGTRVWLDSALRKAGLQVNQIQGYENERMTHFEVAASVAEGQADVGLGLETAAQAYGLDFTYLLRERYDLVIPEPNMQNPSVVQLVEWLASEAARQSISQFGGYDTDETGQLRWVN